MHWTNNKGVMNRSYTRDHNLSKEVTRNADDQLQSKQDISFKRNFEQEMLVEDNDASKSPLIDNVAVKKEVVQEDEDNEAYDVLPNIPCKVEDISAQRNLEKGMLVNDNEASKRPRLEEVAIKQEVVQEDEENEDDDAYDVLSNIPCKVEINVHEDVEDVRLPTNISHNELDGSGNVTADARDSDYNYSNNSSDSEDEDISDEDLNSYDLDDNEADSLEKEVISIILKNGKPKPKAPVRKRILCCNICNASFKQHYHLKNHMLTHTGEKPHNCNVCGRKFAERGNLFTHMRIHTGEKPYKCPKCDMSFKQLGHLQGHLPTHSSERPYACHLCDRAFKQKKSLKFHLEMHDQNSQFNCDLCDRHFNNSMTLKSHKKTFHKNSSEPIPPRPYQCNICYRRFIENENLTIHLRIHSGKDTLECTECGKTFKGKRQLGRHSKIHNDATQIHVCHICNKRFREKSNLKRHVEIHKGDTKLYSCKVCGRSFREKSNLKRHFIVHTNIKPYSCTECGKIYRDKLSLDRHMEKHTNGEEDSDGESMSMETDGKVDSCEQPQATKKNKGTRQKQVNSIDTISNKSNSIKDSIKSEIVEGNSSDLNPIEVLIKCDPMDELSE